VPGHLGKGPVYLAHLAAAADWPTLLTDPDWQSTAGDPEQPFGLFTASPDPSGQPAWDELADYCVQRRLVLVSSWGENSTLLDDAFDMAAVVREVEGLPTSDPLTTWHDHEPLEQALDFFVRFRGDNTNLDLDEDHPAWQRLVLVVGDAAWFEQAEAYLHALSTRADA